MAKEGLEGRVWPQMGADGGRCEVLTRIWPPGGHLREPSQDRDYFGPTQENRRGPEGYKGNAEGQGRLLETMRDSGQGLPARRGTPDRNAFAG